MKSKIILILIALAFALSTQQSFASGKDKRFYISGGVEWFSPYNLSMEDYKVTEDHDFYNYRNNPPTYDFSAQGVREFYNMEASLGDNFSPLAAVGFYLTDIFRIEAEYAYRKSSMNGIEGFAKSYFITDEGCGQLNCGPTHNDDLLERALISEVNQDIKGDIISHSFMANMYVDFPLTEKIKFYAGVGIGVSLIDYKVSEETGIVTAPVVLNQDDIDDYIWVEQDTPAHYESEKDGAQLAGQVMVGASYDLNDTLTLTGGYRYFGVDNTYSSHGIDAGIRINF